MSRRTKPRAAERATQAEFKAFLARHSGVRYLDVVFVDMCGAMRGKRLPVADAEKVFTTGLPMPQSTYFFDSTGVNEDVLGRGVSDGDPDTMAYPIAGTLAPIPWADVPQAQVLMTMDDTDDKPSWLESRNVLAGVVERLAGIGLNAVVAAEFEFYVLDPAPDSEGRPQPPINPRTGERATANDVYAITELDGFMPLLRAIDEAAQAQGVPASAAVAEVAPGQYEINLRHEPSAVAAADHAAMLRHLIKAVARTQDFRASFMAKPFGDRTGSGQHVHCSVTDKAGDNIFDDGSAEGTEQLRHAIGGLQATFGDAMALFAPNLNSYRRFRPNLFVPMNGAWGYNNRSVAFRVPAGPAAARRIEHRIAGADANPYLVIAAVLAGIHHGIENRIDPGPPSTGNASVEIDERLPFDLLGAVERLRRSALMKDYLGGDYVETYAEAKRLEYEKFQRVISPREWAWYL